MNEPTLSSHMHLAINDRELPPKSLKSINLLNDGLSFTRGETKLALERRAAERILSSLKSGDVVEYHMRASNNRLAKGKAHINRMVVGISGNCKSEILVYAFELEPIIEKAQETTS